MEYKVKLLEEQNEGKNSKLNHYGVGRNLLYDVSLN